MKLVRRKNGKAVKSSLQGPPLSDSQSDFSHSLDESINALLARSDAQWAHDDNLDKLTDNNFHACRKLIRAYEKVGVWRLQQGAFSDDAGFYAAELAVELAKTITALVQNGDLNLARRLPAICELFNLAGAIYGDKLATTRTNHQPIEVLLKNHTAKDLLEMLAALYPQWHLMLLEAPNLDFENLPEEKRNYLLMKERLRIEALSEAELRKLLLSKELLIRKRNGQRKEHWQKCPMAEVMESIIARRHGESENINLFVEHLYRGYLWGLPNHNFLKCDWHGREDLPPKHDVKAWMKLVGPFLREATDGDATKLQVFRYLLARRKSVYVGRRLAEDKPAYIWNQLENQIRKAWKLMATNKTKPGSAKAA